ncbi:MAG: signal peptidase I [Acidimicrobiales bacterium]
MTPAEPAPPAEQEEDRLPAASAAPGAQGAPQPTRKRRRPSPSRRVTEWVVIVALAVGAAFGIKAFLIQAFFIPSGSMIPTLKVGDRILVDELSYDLHPIHRGDIVVFAKPPADSGDPAVHDLVKRVVGLPGDTISSAPDPQCHGDPLCSGRVLIDGKPLPGKYLLPYHRAGPGAGEPIPTQVIPKGHYFVMGDNRSDSKDSRFFGPISGSLVVGRVVLRIWPLNAITTF